MAALLSAKGNDGKPVITQEQRAYYHGLNDHLGELISRVLQKGFITRPQHLAVFLSLNLRQWS